MILNPVSGGSGGGGVTIGSTVFTGGIQGSVLFIGAASIVQQDNANLFWDDSNNRLGIGTAFPATKLDVNGTITGVTATLSQATGTAPLTVSSTTVVTNLNADLLDGQHAASFAPVGGLAWTEVTGTSQSAAINSGYIASNASLCTITLPTTAAVGSVIRIAGKGAGGWKLAQNASQLINFLGVATTTGTGGYLASASRYDTLEILCVTADTTWVVLSSVGNITIV